MINRRFTILLSIAGILLLIPLLAMQVSQEVNWSAFDFLIAAILLFGTSIVVEIIIRKVRGKNSRILAVAMALFLLILIWAELAVGLFGNPWAGN